MTDSTTRPLGVLKTGNTQFQSERPNCELCGEPMPEGEDMFKFHGYSGPCPVKMNTPVTDVAGSVEEQRQAVAQQKALQGFDSRTKNTDALEIAKIINPLAFDEPGHTDGLYQTPEYLSSLQKEAIDKAHKILRRSHFRRK